MARVYFDLIMIGEWELENVPYLWYDQVLQMLEDAGYFEKYPEKHPDYEPPTEPDPDEGENSDDPEPEPSYPDAPTSVSITPEVNNFSETGVIRYLQVEVLPETADQNVTWSSADTTIALIDQDGKVMARGVGSTTITATAVNGVVGTATVNVAGN